MRLLAFAVLVIVLFFAAPGAVGAEGLFSDELGQLLVKRTILYIYAGEEKTAWQTLERDAAKHYRADVILPKIRQEIREILWEGSY